MRYAQQGAQFAERSSSTAAVWLPVSEARAWAALGNVAATQHAIERAEGAWDNVHGDELDRARRHVQIQPGPAAVLHG